MKPEATDQPNILEIKEEQKDDQHQKRVVEEQNKSSVLKKIEAKFDCNYTEILNGFLQGFNHATASGPLCEEPMQGACFIIQHVDLVENEVQDTYGPFGG